MQAIQEASLEVLYEDENGQAYIPEEKMYKLASKKSKLAISTLRWANENRQICKLDKENVRLYRSL